MFDLGLYHFRFAPFCWQMRWLASPNYFNNNNANGRNVNTNGNMNNNNVNNANGVRPAISNSHILSNL